LVGLSWDRSFVSSVSFSSWFRGFLPLGISPLLGVVL
jgi:hypothetical protein